MHLLKLKLPRLAIIGLSALATVSAASLRLPPFFEQNAGQWPKDTRFVARHTGYTATLTANEIVIRSSTGGADLRQPVSIGFPGANPMPKVEAQEPRRAVTNYAVGRRENWRTASQFNRLVYRELYPGIDLEYYFRDGQLEFDFVVKPGADPNRIRIDFGGSGSPRLVSGGDLVIGSGEQEFRQRLPYAYQKDTGGGHRQVAANYRIARDGKVRFELGAYERSRTLVIDPVIVYSSFLGASLPEIGTAIAVDTRGKVWVAGNTSSDGLPTRGGEFSDARFGGQDVFIARFDPTVSGDDSLEMLTYFGGTALDEVRAIQVTPGGFLALAGSTSSTDFPVAGNTFQTQNGGERDVFVALLNPFESFEFQFAYSTYLGGESNDIANAVTADADGNIYVTGYTTSEEFPLSGAPLQGNKRGGYDMFISKLAPSRAAGENLEYSTYLGTETTDTAHAIAVDRAGMIYVGGYTYGEDFPISGPAYRAAAPGGGDGVLVKIDPFQGFPNSLVYGTYFGGSRFDKLYALALDNAGAIVVAGYTDSDDLPVTDSGYQRRIGGESDVFVARLDLNRSPAEALTYATYLGGSGTEVLYGAAIDGSNRVVVTGYTLSENFPAKGSAVQNGFGGAIDAFVSWIDPAATGEASLLGSSPLGGTSIDAGYGVAADSRGRAYLTGFTTSGDFPVTPGGWGLGHGGIYDSYVTAIDF